MLGTTSVVLKLAVLILVLPTVVLFYFILFSHFYTMWALDSNNEKALKMRVHWAIWFPCKCLTINIFLFAQVVV